MRYTGPRNRLARRRGVDLELKTVGSKNHARLLNKLGVLPGQHSTRGRRKVSEHGKQLDEKQKLRFTFGINESQMKIYFKVAKKTAANTGLILSQLLERRLDNTVYRLGFSPTRAAARQLVVHKHITVNGKIMNSPSYQTKVNDVIGFKHEATKDIPAVAATLQKTDLIIPSWLERKEFTGKIAALPTAEMVEKQINLRYVIEFYSR